MEGRSSRTIDGGGLTVDIARPDGQGDLADGGGVTIVVRGTNPLTSSCRWTLDGVNKGPADGHSLRTLDSPSDAHIMTVFRQACWR